jgi:hypothetical protein
MRVTGVRAYNANPPLKHTWHVGSNEKLDHVVHIRVLTINLMAHDASEQGLSITLCAGIRKHRHLCNRTE